MKCWKCNASNLQQKKMRVGRIRTTAEQILQGAEDLNMYQTYLVCPDCEYRLSIAQDNYLRLIVHNHERNTKIANLAARFAVKRHPTMVYVARTPHADLLNLMIRQNLIDAGLDPNLCRVVHGKLDDADNSAVKASFINRQIRVVIATSIWGEGTDIPILRWIIYAKAGNPGIELEQVIGRGLRIAPGKWRAGFIDFQDLHNSDFADKSRSRARFLERKGFKIKTLESQPGARRVRNVSQQKRG